ncbi:MAG: prolyl oligopeptidase family serine peptidase [Planctomycetaceae bacterium]|nr:prolyl oligopeptidase family serine peptidase [Planctomycetaceae bacterium]
MSLRMISVLLILAGTLCVRPLPGAEPAQQEVHREATVTVSLNYLLSLPPGYEKQDAWPLLLFLHGGGERGDNLALVKTHGPPKMIAAGQPFPFVVVSPQCPRDGWWQPTELLTLLDDVERTCKIDKDRIYVTGLSLGGMGTWELAAYAPERFAAIVPICGGGEAYWARRISKVPTWVFHGAEDVGVPLRRSQEMVDALRKAGGEVRFTVYPHTGHLSWTTTYNNPELYSWLLQQRRQNR